MHLRQIGADNGIYNFIGSKDLTGTSFDSKNLYIVTSSFSNISRNHKFVLIQNFHQCAGATAPHLEREHAKNACIAPGGVFQLSAALPLY